MALSGCLICPNGPRSHTHRTQVSRSEAHGFRAKREQLKAFVGLEAESQGHDLPFTVFNGPDSFNSGMLELPYHHMLYQVYQLAAETRYVVWLSYHLLPPALLAGSNRLFQFLHLYWNTPDSGSLWCK